MNAHTPEPWIYLGPECKPYIQADGGQRIATVEWERNLSFSPDFNVAEETDEAAANGRLIAAAPDLLAACLAVLDEDSALDGGFLTTSRQLLEQAIAKTEGRES